MLQPQARAIPSVQLTFPDIDSVAAAERSLSFRPEVLTAMQQEVMSRFRVLGQVIPSLPVAEVVGGKRTVSLRQYLPVATINTPVQPGDPDSVAKLVIDNVAELMDVTVEQILGPERDRRVATARHIGAYTARETMGLKYPKIGEAFGWADHTTAIHAYEKIKRKLLDGDPETQRMVEELACSLPDTEAETSIVILSTEGLARCPTFQPSVEDEMVVGPAMSGVIWTSRRTSDELWQVHLPAALESLHSLETSST